jgi:thiamine-monophosphate kinase
MDEFSLIDTYFKSIQRNREDVVFGIGDDAACLEVPAGMQLLVSTDTLVDKVHFLTTWGPYDIASRSVRTTISDIAAMGGTPSWLSLALTLPEFDASWLHSFSQGLKEVLDNFNISLIGGDTTRGPLSITLTIHGLVPKHKCVRRKGAAPGDSIYVSGDLGGAAFALVSEHRTDMNNTDKQLLMKKLLHPEPRIDMIHDLQTYASAAIDISDGLSSDLSHICKASQVGAHLDLNSIPLYPLITKYQTNSGLDFALHGGDDYEICFTVSPENEADFLLSLASKNTHCFRIGLIEETLGLRGMMANGEMMIIEPKGYNHVESK